MAEGIAIGGGRILAVGGRGEVMSHVDQGTRVVDLEGRTVLPGFTDSHCHLASAGASPDVLQLGDSTSLGALLSRVEGAVRTVPKEAWIRARGWDESKWVEARFPTLKELDGVTGEHPTILMRVDGHLAVANSAALRQLPAGDLPGMERDGRGKPTGVLREGAAERLWMIKRPGTDQIVKGIRKMAARAHRLGVTSIHDVVDAQEASAYLHLLRRGELDLRVNLMPRATTLPHLRELDFPSRSEGDRLRLGPLKLFVDGSIGARTAALSSEFRDEPGNQGWLSDDIEQLLATTGEAVAAGFQLALHAIGDRAIAVALDGIEKTGQSGGRHRIEHFELPSEESLRRAARLGVVASMQPDFVGQWSLPGGLYSRRLSDNLFRRNNPFRLILDEGIPLVFGSDLMPFSPLYGVHWAVNAPFGDQRIEVEEALEAYTKTPAYASFEEERKGTIEPGRLADLVVLEGDPRKNPDSIESIPVHMTILDGRIVHIGG